MDIALATNNDLYSLMHIWKICFNTDSIFLDMFFKDCFPLSKTYVWKEENVVVSSVTILPISFKGEEKIKGIYIYGGCTLPQYRGHNLLIKLINYIEEIYKEKEYGFIALRPATPSLFAFYRKNGFSQPIYRQLAEISLPIFADGVSFTELSATRLKTLRNKHLNHSFFEWDTPMLEFIIKYIKYLNGSSVELESDRYLIGYPDPDDSSLYNILELGSYNPNTIKYPTLYLAGNLIKSRHLERTKAKLYLPLYKNYEDISAREREVFVLVKPLISEVESDAFFNFSLE